MSIIRTITDSLTNLVSRMGTERDKASATTYGFSVLTDDQIFAAYKTAWLPRKIVDIPAFDSVRAWRDWQAKPKQIEDIEAEEKRLNVKSKVLLARKRARLWGGAAILLGTGDANMAEPIDVEHVKQGGLKYLTVLTRRQLSAGAEIERDPESEWYGLPKTFTLTSQTTQASIHPSRMVIFIGNEPADEDLDGAMHPGWGDSVLQSTLDAIKQTDGTAANIASMIFEAKVDIIRVPDFMLNLGNEEYRKKVVERFTLANMGKGINGTLMLDKEEEYETKSASFANLPDVMDRFLQIVSGAADIPATRLLGQSPAGMNATGESDLRNYYDRLSSMQVLEMEPAMRVLDECLIRSATGARDQDIHFAWAPLWGMSETEKATVFKTKADAARALAGTGGASPSLMPIEALSDALVNELIEDGSLSGLEAAIEEYGRLSEQEEPSAEEIAAAAALARPQPALPKPKQPTADATPRTLYVYRKVKNGDAIASWAKSQGLKTTLPAADMHVTIAFSRTPVDWMLAGQAWSSEIKVGKGGPRVVERFGKATVLLFAASELKWRHKDIINEAGASWDHPDYQPHITLSYEFEGEVEAIEPYQGDIILGQEVFEEVKADWESGLSEE